MKDDPNGCTAFDASKNILGAILCSLGDINKYICSPKLGH